MSHDPATGPEVERWDRSQAEMLENLPESVRLGVLTPDEYAEAMSAVLVKIGEHREQAELRDLWRWSDEIEATGNPKDAEFAQFVRRFILEKRESQGKFGPP